MSQKRDYRSNNSKFYENNIATESLEHENGNDGLLENKLGEDYWNKYWMYPTLNTILKGIKEHEKVQLQKTSGPDPASKEFQEAYEGKCEAWDSYFDEISDFGKITDFDHDAEIHEGICRNPDH